MSSEPDNTSPTESPATRPSHAPDVHRDDRVEASVAALEPALRARLAAKGATAEDLDHLVRETISRLVIGAHRAHAAGEPVANLRGYASTVAERVFSDHLRRTRPNWCRLKRRICYVLDMPDNRVFALWRISDSAVGGLLRWRGQKPKPISPHPVHGIDVDAFTAAFDGRDPCEMGLPELLARVLRRLDGPAEIDDLTRLVARLTELTEPTFDPVFSMDGADRHLDSGMVVEDHGPKIASDLQAEKLAEELWSQIESLTDRQRTALLLGMDSDQWLLLAGTVGRAARALSLSTDELHSIRLRLPLPDREIGDRLGATTLQVSNLRKCAREKLQRWLTKQNLDAE